VNIEVDETAGSALVPQLVLQPLVENAIRHGMDSVTFEVRLSILARVENDMISLVVRDRGPGIDLSAPIREGIGLRNTRERFERLYGDSQSFTIRNANDRGLVVELRFPFSRTHENPALAISQTLTA
jgi:LytS/YehU family sensor histidine kinase